MPNDPIFRTILICLGLTVIGGAILAIMGEQYFQDESMKNLGIGVVLIAGACYLFFRILGVRQARRAAKQAEQKQISSGGEEERDL